MRVARPFVLPAQGGPFDDGLADAPAGEATDGDAQQYVGWAALELAVKGSECDRPGLGSAVANDLDGVLASVSERGALGQVPGNGGRGTARAYERSGECCDPRPWVEAAEAIDGELDPRRADGQVQRATAAPADVGHHDVVGHTRCHRQAPK